MGNRVPSAGISVISPVRPGAELSRAMTFFTVTPSGTVTKRLTARPWVRISRISAGSDRAGMTNSPALIVEASPRNRASRVICSALLMRFAASRSAATSLKPAPEGTTNVASRVAVAGGCIQYAPNPMTVATAAAKIVPMVTPILRMNLNTRRVSAPEGVKQSGGRTGYKKCFSP